MVIFGTRLGPGNILAAIIVINIVETVQAQMVVMADLARETETILIIAATTLVGNLHTENTHQAIQSQG